MNLKIKRQSKNSFQTLGKMFVYDDCYEEIYSCHCLELPDLNNKFSVSRIPSGTYKVVKRWSKKYGYHFHVKDVDNRTWILIHSGNTYRDTRGCILPGDSLTDINKDNELDVINSRKTLNKLLELLPQYFTLKIEDED